MAWNKGKVEKAWRIFDKAMGVIAEALDVPTDELKALILEGELPNMDAPAASMDGKRATLADIAPPAPEKILEEAAPIIEQPIQFTTSPPFATMSPETQAAVTSIAKAAAAQIRKEPKRFVPAVSKPAHNAVKSVDDMIGDSLEERARPLPPSQRRSNLAAAADDKRRAGKPVEFFLMLDGKYLHESCTGLTGKRQHAWRQPESRIAAVRRKFPETVDYTEVPAS